MAKKNQHIDDFFKDRLQGEQLPLDGSEWGKIYEELHGKKKRRFFWLWLLLPLVIFGAWFMVQSTGSESDLPSEGQMITKAEAQTSASKNTVENTTPSTPASESSAQIKEANPLNSGSITGNNDISNGKDLIATSSSQVDKNYAGSVFQSSDANQGINTSSGLSSDTEYGISKELLQFSIVLPNPKSKGLKFGPYVNIPLPVYKQKHNKKTPFKPSVQIGLTVGMNLNQSILKADDSFYEDVRRKNDVGAWSPELGLSVQITGFKGWVYGFGVSHQTVNYGSSKTMRQLIYDSIGVYDQQGNLVSWLPWNHREVIIEDFERPSLSFITVPMSIGRNFAIGGAFSLHTGLELQTKIAIGAKGTSLNAYYKPYSLSMQDFNPIAMAGGFRLGLNYNINPNYMMTFRTGMRYDINNLSAASHFTQRFAMYTTEFGLYYRLR